MPTGSCCSMNGGWFDLIYDVVCNLDRIYSKGCMPASRVACRVVPSYTNAMEP